MRIFADIECLFKCDKLDAKSMLKSFEMIEKFDFFLEDRDSLSFYTVDTIVPNKTLSGGMDALRSTPPGSDVSVVIARFEGDVFGAKTKLPVCSDFRNEVLSLSMSEERLWNYEKGKFDIERILFFSKLCRGVSEIMSPILAYFGTESVHPEELDPSNLDHVFDKDFFSKENMNELYRWYNGEYSKGWRKL